MLRTGFLICLQFALLPVVVHAQGKTDVPGWEVLPDSLFLIWHLDQDQVQRLGVIEEDYNTERQNVAADTKLDDAQKEARLRKLGNARMKELKGVLGAEDFLDWSLRLEADPSPLGH